jgi:Fe-S cluster assembly ATP-binding protein
MFGDEYMLSIDKINVSVGDKEIIKDFSLEIKKGEVHAIMGPNGTGKSTLSKVLFGNKNYKLDSGKILFEGQDITKLTVDERARLGMFLSMQNPISIDGVQNSEFIKTAVNSKRETPIGLYEFIKNMEDKTKELGITDEMIHRSLNVGASGGERKKNEVLQMCMLEPKFIILDELDSGLDIDSLKSCTKAINKYLEEHKDAAVLMITHYPRILEYIKPDYVHMMVNGTIVKTGDYNLALEIEKNGYEKVLDENNNE